MKSIHVLLPVCLSLSLGVHADDLDDKIALIQKVYALQPKTCEPTPPAPERIKAGKELFESKALSGDRDIACANCHLDRFGSADGLPIAVGVGGQGEGKERYAHHKGTLVQRNALSLIGRADPVFTAYFWDGKVQLEGERIVSQFGDAIDGRFDSPLAVAAILPLLERDEFMGETKVLEPNDIQYVADGTYYYDKYQAVGQAIRNRLQAAKTPEDQQARDLLQASGVAIDRLELADIGNLLAAFIADKFPCRVSAWDRYLSGDHQALGTMEKTGVVLFYGKGRCASCHAGPFFSDFQYHSIGTPQGGFGPHSRHRDIGRAGVTHRRADLYQFRTPPLIEVNKTAPYGHNGIFASLKDVITHHNDPVSIYIQRPDIRQADRHITGKLLHSRDGLLATIDIHSDAEIQAFIAFLKTI